MGFCHNDNSRVSYLEYLYVANTVFEMLHLDSDYGLTEMQSLQVGLAMTFVWIVIVSYGDKTPRSPPGRCFGIIWITVGIILMSVLTATLAAAFVEQEAPFGDITDKNVGNFC